MDPLTALGLAASVAQLVDVGFRIIGHAREIYSSVSGVTGEDRSLENAAHQVQQLIKKLAAPEPENPTEEEKLLSGLVAECRDLSNQLLALLDKTRAKDPRSKIQSTLAALKSMRYEKEKLLLQKRLDDCQNRLDRYLQVLARCVLNRFDRVEGCGDNCADKSADLRPRSV
jgi:hypothetical protein